MKTNLREYSKIQLLDVVVKQGEKDFRANQIYSWLWCKGIRNIEEMSNIPKSLRDFLNSNYTLNTIIPENVQKSNDGTLKCLFKLHDGLYIESVIIPTKDRNTICISSQVGCKLKCKFCATGTIGFKRNLETGEIFDQVKLLNDISLEHDGKRISNIVLMGMGEPLYNYINVNNAIEHITLRDGLGFSPKRITLSTIGIPVMIKKMADDNVKYNLAVSLHAAIQEKRINIMPVARNHTLDMLMESLQYYTAKTGQKITFEYVMLKGVNDTKEDAVALVKYASKLSSKINLIEYNPVDGLKYQRSGKPDIESFSEILKKKGIIVNIRQSRGDDIDAACGQLANKLMSNR